MLVINNGAIKSGSTWLYNLLVNLRAFESPAARYLTGGNPKHPCIRPERLATFLESEDVSARDFISKNHLSDPKHRDLLLAHPDVRVFDIERDPRDVIVSNFYHDKFRNGYGKEFPDYYWEHGQSLVRFLTDYHALWRDAGPRVLIASYERLHIEFAVEVRRIAALLGRELSDQDVAQLKEATSMSTLRKKYAREPRFEGERFFRKGEIGDWRNHFDEAMIEDVARIERGDGPMVPKERVWASRLRKLFPAR